MPVLLIAAAAIAANPLAHAQSPQGPTQGDVLTYHGGADRSGNFTVPGLTWERARSLHVDETFHARVAGNVYAQPLYWRSQRSDRALEPILKAEVILEARKSFAINEASRCDSSSSMIRNIGANAPKR